jgi:hypothetical protein
MRGQAPRRSRENHESHRVRFYHESFSRFGQEGSSERARLPSRSAWVAIAIPTESARSPMPRAASSRPMTDRPVTDKPSLEVPAPHRITHLLTFLDHFLVSPRSDPRHFRSASRFPLGSSRPFAHSLASRRFLLRVPWSNLSRRRLSPRAQVRKTPGRACDRAVGAPNVRSGYWTDTR